jgi:replicative DNA helicase
MDVCLRKNRNGAVGEVQLHFDAPTMTVTNIKKT